MLNTLISRFRSFCAVIALCVASTIQAGWNVPVTNYAVADYTAGTQNWQLVTTSNGWLYAANNYGLLEFDGARWRIYGMYYGNLPRSIAKYNDQAIFIGATNDFGVFMPTADGGMRYTSLMPEGVEPDYGEVWDIEVVEQRIYIFARHRIIIASFNITEDVELTDVHIIRTDSRVFCAENAGGAIYVGTDNGIYLLTGTRMNRIHGSDILKGYEVRCIQVLDSQRLLIGTDLGGLFVYDGTRIFAYHTEADSFIRKNQLYTLAVREDKIALGTVLQGLVVVDTTGHVIRYVSRSEGLQNNTILSMAFDSRNNLWVGLDQGIDYVQLASHCLYLSDNRTNMGTGYATLRASDRICYFGTNQGLYRAISNRSEQSIQTAALSFQLVEGSMGQVWSLSEIDGTLFCCHNRGLFVVDDNVMRPLCTDEGFWQVRQLPDGRLLAGSYSGFRLISKVRGTRRNADDWRIVKVKGFDDTAFRWQVDATGAIWAVATSGVVHLRWKDHATLVQEHVQAYNGAHDWFNISKIGAQVLISSRDYCRVVTEEGELRRDTTVFARLAGETYYSLACQDSKGNLLYVHDGSLYIRVRTNNGYLPAYPLYIGETDFVGGFENLYELDGSYIIGTLHGYNLLNPLGSLIMQQDAHVSPTIYLREARSLNSDSIVYGESLVKARIEKEVFSLPYDNHALLFRFAVDRIPATDVRYAYRLLPRDKDFSAYTSTSQLECSLPKEGRYTLEVLCRSTDQSGEAAVSKQAWSFVILPPWYRTWWARVLEVLFVVFWLLALVWVIYVFAERSKRKTLHEQQLRILQLENDKTQTRLQAKSRELTRILHAESTRQEEFAYVTEELDKVLRDLQSHNVKKADDRVQALRQHLSADRDNSIDWQRFEENFDEVHAGFCKCLTERFPWMNKQERKLCVYIHIGMLTKEIAPLLGLSTRGVEMMRYRMRCKMGLDAQANLKDYLHGIVHDVQHE